MITKRMIMKNLRKLGFLHVMVMVFILAFLASAPPWAHAQIPRYINYQGKLTDIDDNPVTGDVSVTVRLYDAESEGTALWTETQSVTATRGIFSILLGSTTALDDLNFNSAYWYSVEVESDGEMTPRQRLTAVGYAMNADTLDGYDSSDFLKTTPSGELSLTGGANEDIELNPTGTGNVIITIDSTSGDFKVTDGTTNWLLVDHTTGNVTIAQDLTVGGTIYGSFASEDGDSTFTTITVTGASDLRGNIASSTGAVTIADTLTQTGASNQITLAGNLDANSGVDVTGALTVSGATTLSSALDANANIDLDYSGTSAALDVTQASTGAAAQFTGGRVLVGTATSNAYALSTGELYVQGDLEVDGTIYGNITGSGSQSMGDTTLSSLTVTGASDLQGNVADSAGTYTIADNIDVTPSALTSGGTDDYALNIAQTLNDTGAAGGSDVYRGVKINVTETDTTGWDNVYLMDLQVDEASKFRIDNSGNVTVSGTVDGVDIAALKTAADLDYDAVGDLPTAAVTDGATTTIATGDQIYDFVTGEGYITDDTSVAKGDLADSGTLGFDWADGEVADILTISGGTIENTIIGAATPAAATVTGLTMKNTGSATVMTFDDGTATGTMVYDSTAGYPLWFSDKMSVTDMELRGASPAAITFGSGANKISLIYDPSTDEIRFSRGTFAQDFRNLVKNGSFESFSAMEEFHDYDMGYATAAPEGTEFGGVWDKTDGFQGGWENFAPDDWDYVSGDVFQHAPLFFKQDFTMTDIDAEHFKEDFTEGKSAVRLGYINDNALAGPPDLRPGKISQVISGLKPSSVYGIGVKVRVEYTLDGQNNKIPAGTARIDIEGEDGGNTDPADNTTTTLSTTLNASDTIVGVLSVEDFPPFGIIVLESEHIRYEGTDDTTTPQRFLKCTRATNGTNAEEHDTTGVNITLAPFQASTTSTDVEFVKLEGQFCTDTKASDITIVLSAELGSVYFDTVQLVAGGTVPEYTPNAIVATGDQALYGSFAIRRSSDEKGGILSVDKFVRTRGIELFSDDPGFSGAIGGGGMNIAGGGGGIFPPGQGWNDIDQQQPAIQLYTRGDYSSDAPQVRDYKVTIDNDAGTTFKWYYMDATTGWDYTTAEGGWVAGNSGNSIALTNDSNNYIPLDYGVEVCFSDTTGAKGDTWWFNASNETFGQGDFYGEENTYVHGKTRIYVDPDPFSPYFNQMVFEDGATRVSLGDLAGTVETGASFTHPSSMGMLGSLSLDVSGAYDGGLGDIQYEVEISSEGDGATPDSFYYRVYSGDVWGGYSAETVISGNPQDVGNGLFVSFWEPDYNFLNGVLGDKWTFNAYAGVAAESKVSTLNNRSGDLVLDPGSNITIDYPEAGKIRIAATVTDGDASAINEIQDLWATISDGASTTTADSSTDTLTISGAGIATTAVTEKTLTITATEADTLQSVTDRIGGAITSNSIAVTSADGIVIGEDKIAPALNTAGTIKLFSAGDNALYTTFTAGTQTDNADYILPTASTNGLLKNTAGTLSWDGTAYITGVAWSEITGTLSNQTDLSDALALKAPLADPAFTGTPTAPTATAGDSDTSIATTAFVDTAVQTGIAGLSWKEAALSLIAENDTTVPPDETLGNRYVLAKDGGVPHVNWDGAVAGDMVQFNGTAWVKETPQDGDAVFIEDVDTGYVYTGSAWTPFTGASAYTWGTGLAADGNRIDTVDAEIDHNSLSNTHNLTTDIDHSTIAGVVAAEHVDWAAQDAGTVHASNYVDNINDNVSGTELDGVFSTTGLLTRTGAATYATITDSSTNWGTAYTHSQVAGGDSVHVSTTENTNWDSAYTHSTSNSQAHTDYLLNVADTIAGTLTIATATPSDLVIDNATVGTPDGGDLASDSGAIILRGNYFNDTGDSDTPIDMSVKVDITDASAYKLSFFDDSADPTEIASLDQAGALQIDGALTIGSTALSEANLTALTDEGETSLHSHSGLAPGAHAASHQSGGGDALAFDDLTDGTTYKKFLDTERTKLTNIETAADVTDATNVASAGAIMASYASAQTIQPTADVVPLTIKGKASASSNVLSIYNAAASPAEKIYVGSEGQMYIAEDTSAGAKDSTATLNFGRNETDDWETMGYDPTLGTKGMFTFSAPLEVEASSPTGITFVEKDAQGNITQSQGFMYDPDKDEFSFTGGKLKQAFQNLMRSGSFESYRPSGWYSTRGYYSSMINTNYSRFGDQSVMIYDDSNFSSDYIGYYIPDCDRFRGGTVTLSVWARCHPDSGETSTTAKASIGISSSGTISSQDIDLSYDNANSTPWRNYTFTYTVPANAYYLYVRLYGAAGGSNVAAKTDDTTGGVTGSSYIYYDGVTMVEGNLALEYGPSPIYDSGDQVIGGSLAIGADVDPYTDYGTNYYSYPRLVFGEPDSNFGTYYGGWSMGSGEISFRRLSGSSGMFTFNRPIGMDSYDMSSSSWNKPALFIGNLYDYGSTDVDIPDYAFTTKDAYIKGVMEVDGGIYGDIMSFHGGIGRSHNKITYSADFANAVWSKGTGMTVDTNSGSFYIGPDGSSNASKLISTVESTIDQTISVTGNTTYTFSVYVKADGMNTYPSTYLMLKSNLDASWWTWPNYKWVDLWNSLAWKRSYVTITTPAGASTLTARIHVYGGSSYNTIRVWGAQIRESDSPGIYIATTDTPVNNSTALFHGDGSGLTNLAAANISGSSAITGITGNVFTINEDAASPGGDMSVVFNRGATDGILKWDETNGRFDFNGGLKIYGTIVAGTGANAITTSTGLLDATKLTGTIAAGRLPSDGYASTYVNVGSDTMTGKLTINETATITGAQALDVNSTGVMAGSASKIIASVSDSAAHTTTGSVTGLELTLAGAYNNVSADATALSIDLTSITGTSGTERGIDIQMGAASDSAINTNAKIVAATLTDGTASISGGAISGVSSITTGTLNVASSSTFTGDLDVGGGYTGTSGGGITLESDGDIYFDGNMYQTGSIYTVDTVRFTGNYDVGLISKFGVGAGGGDADYLQINADGYIIDMDDPVTINDALSQTGAGQVTLSGNVDAQSGIDVTGANLTLDSNDLVINTSKFTVDGVTGNTSVAGTLGVTGNLDAASGLDVTGANLTLDSNDLLINTNKFTVDGVTGNTSIGGTLGVTNTTTLNGPVTLGDNGDTVTINSSDWDISATGAVSGIGAITMDGNLTGSATQLNIDKSYSNQTGTVNDHIFTRTLVLDDGTSKSVSGAVVTIDAVDTQTSGILTDNSTLLKLKTGANVGAVGYFIDAQNSQGVSKFNVNAAGTGNFAGDLSVTGDLNVSGSQVISGTTLYDSATTVRVNSANALLVEKANVTTAGTGYDVLIIDTTGSNSAAGLVGINTTPASGVELDVSGDADFSGTLKVGTSDAFAIDTTGNVTLVNNATLDGVDISDFATSGILDHAKLTSIGTNTHTAIDSHIAATGTSVHSLGTISTQAANNVSITGGSVTGISALGVTSGAVSVDAGQKLNVEGSTGNSYMQFNSSTDKIEIFVNGEVVAYIKN